MSEVGGPAVVGEPRLTSTRPESICPMPWTNLSLDVDGSSRPCCKFAHQTPGSAYQMANLADADIATVWNSDGMVKLRADFRDGQRPEECRTCWDEESAGVASWRQQFLADRHLDVTVDYDDLRPEAPIALDLKLSNACNLKCRICGPVASSLWLQEQLRSAEPIEVADLKAHRRFYLANKITQVDVNAETFRSWIPHLQHVELTGGEPMFSLENREVIELLVESGRAPKISLLITTNAMAIDDRIIAALPNFANVAIAMSVDDMGPRLEYERHPAKWETVRANMDRYAAQASATQTRHTNCSVSSLNVWYLPEFLRWHNHRYPGLGLYLNIVHGARCFNVQNMPEPLKATVSARLEEVAADGALEHFVRVQVRQLISFLHDAPPDPAAWDELLVSIRERDKLRDEEFATTFPELHGEIQRLGLGEASPPTSSGQPVDTPIRRIGRRLLHR